MRELHEVAVEVVGRRVRVLEEENRAFELDLPRRPHRLHEQPEAPPDERRRDPAAVERAHPRIVGVVWHLARAAGAEHVEETLLRERGRVGRADAQEAVAVDRRDARTLPDRDVESRQVRVADERLRVVRDQVEVEERDRLCRPEPALQCLDDVDLRIGVERVQVLRAAPRVTRDVVVALPDAPGELDRVAASLPPLDPAEDVGTAVVGARRRGHADRAAWWKRLPEPCRCDHLQMRTVWLASASRPRTSEATAVSTCAPLRFPPVRHVIS